MKKGDLILIGIVLVLSLSGLALYQLYFASHEIEGARIVISQNGDEWASVPLFEKGRSESIVFTGPVGETVVILGEDFATVEHSDCPDQICVSFGKAKRPGQTITCLPNRVFIRIEGGQGQDIDI
ncbi:NusG domain II-containing protein [Proteinivorax hydrogeniformans]|uniref:NusG domain II-containing protein n=1 Tax=Proteinivorax hydrogeniformans TaxID=1826727 RepID=A0AAU8HWL1_9FIRM